MVHMTKRSLTTVFSSPKCQNQLLGPPSLLLMSTSYSYPGSKAVEASNWPLNSI